MNSISTTQLTDALQWRYATKSFDPARKLSADTWAALEKSLIHSPSSYGLQPYKFLIITSAAVRETHYDLILLDVEMPVMTGFDLCKQIREMPGYRHTPVVFVTNHADFESRSKVVLSGGNDLIAKPVLPIELAVKSVALLLKNNLDAQTAAVGAAG